MKDKYAFVLKSIKKNTTISPCLKPLHRKTYIVAGATRGIGFNIAKKLALSNAYVSILGKTIKPHPKLDNTIYTAAEKIKEAAQSPTCMAIPHDVRNNNSKQLDYIFNETEDVFGKVDGIVLNASALCLNNTLNQTEKEIELIYDMLEHINDKNIEEKNVYLKNIEDIITFKEKEVYEYIHKKSTTYD